MFSLCVCVYMRVSENTCVSQISPSTMWVQVLKLQLSDIGTNAVTH